ncbi:MAG: sigma-70 family RNA polymerase sigma factor [Chloroflexota bacterium]|nr:sigma-70 family RNA polymerase sigma factor [Chloroflexota bacterium]
MLRRRAETVPEVPPPPAPAPDPGEDRQGAARADERLVRAAQAGDLDAFNLLVLRHERAVFNVCLRLLRDVPAAEDAAQDAFLKAWTAIGSFRVGEVGDGEGRGVRPWLLRIAVNRSFDLLRARRRRPAAPLEAEPFEIEPAWSSLAPDEPPEAFALRGELAIFLERALAALLKDQRLVVLLADVQGCDYREIAAVTGAALGTVKSRLSRARARLRQELRDDPAGGELFERYGRFFEGFEDVADGGAGLVAGAPLATPKDDDPTP